MTPAYAFAFTCLLFLHQTAVFRACGQPHPLHWLWR